MSIQALFSGKAPPVLEDFNEGAEFFDKFHQENNHRKLEVISTHVGLRRILDKLLSLPESYDKSDTYAKNLLNWGSREFNSENYTRSYRTYCHAVSNATGESLLHALDSRSSVHLHLGLYEECIADIKIALQMECSNELKCILYKRLGLCLTHLKQYREALEAFRNSDSALQKMKSVSVEVKREMKQLILSSLSNAVTVAKLSGSQVPEKADVLPPLSYGSSKPHSCLSTGVEIGWSESKGRELVANRWLKRGDVLVVEPSFASVLLKLKVHTDENEARLTRCSECIDSIISPIPCTQCIYVSYCSETCRKNAWEKFHRFECGHSKVLGYLDWTGRLALQMMLSIGETLVAQVAVDVGCYNELSNGWGNDQGDDLNRMEKRSEQEDCYRRIYGMVSHLGKENAWNNFKFHWMAFFISNFLLRKTDFFATILPKDSCDTPKEKLIELAVAFRALLHLSQVVVNAMTVQDMWSNPCLLSSIGWGVAHGQVHPEEHNFSALGWNIPVARAIYLSASTINHSCHPNAKCSWYKKYVIVKATRDIAPGEEILISYLGHDYKEKEVSARVRYLEKNYFFICECAACTNPSIYPEKYFKANRCLECEGPMLRKGNEAISSEVCNKDANGDTPVIKSNFQDSKKEKKKNKYKLKKVPQKCSVVEEQQNYLESYLVCQNCKSVRRENEDLQKICEGATYLSQGNYALKSLAFDTALTALGECLKVYKKCLYKNHMRFVQILDMMGRAHTNKGDYVSAVECVIQSLPILEKLDFGNMLYAFQLQKLGELIIFCLMKMERSTVFRLKYKRAKECLTSAKEIYQLNGGKWLWVMKELEKQERVIDVIGHWLKKDNGLSIQETIERHFPNDNRHTQRLNYVFLYLDYWFSESLIP